MKKSEKYHNIAQIGFLIGIVPLALIPAIFGQIYIAILLLLLQTAGGITGLVFGNKSLKEMDEEFEKSQRSFWNTYYSLEKRKN